ncbi:hypothetical protein BKA70DRAFT_1314932 [Coprinopsis sp. MPI-PUGE-AT-0042]|nr:hypothetical protein BKA70DRAFT_1314932 [Coprinopsis sp. MPI-PUGE-AT-0042]
MLTRGARLPITYAPPRSGSPVNVNGETKLSFRGDTLTGTLDPNDRTPYPERLVRGLLSSGFASLHHPRDWSLNHASSEVLRSEFDKIVEELSDALDFSRTIGMDSSASYDQGGRSGTLATKDSCSHSFEEALTRALTVPSSLKSKASSLAVLPLLLLLTPPPPQMDHPPQPTNSITTPAPTISGSAIVQDDSQMFISSI